MGPVGILTFHSQIFVLISFKVRDKDLFLYTQLRHGQHSTDLKFSGNLCSEWRDKSLYSSLLETSATKPMSGRYQKMKEWHWRDCLIAYLYHVPDVMLLFRQLRSWFRLRILSTFVAGGLCCFLGILCILNCISLITPTTHPPYRLLKQQWHQPRSQRNNIHSHNIIAMCAIHIFMYLLAIASVSASILPARSRLQGFHYYCGLNY
jgi:hypothetical protein